MILDSEGEGKADIEVYLGVGRLGEIALKGPVRLSRGRMNAYGDESRLIWTHPDLGPFIEVLPREGRVRAILPDWAWLRVQDVLEQILLPGLLPPFAARGFRAIHASAVDFNGEGVILAGDSGSGKTTAALMLVQEGGKLVADDLTFYSREDDIYSIYGMGVAPRGEEQMWKNFPQWIPEKTLSSKKLSLPDNVLPWVKRSRLKMLILLGESLEGAPANSVRLLTQLLSLIYLDKFGPTAVKSLVTLTRKVQLHASKNAESAVRFVLEREHARESNPDCG